MVVQFGKDDASVQIWTAKSKSNLVHCPQSFSHVGLEDGKDDSPVQSWEFHGVSSQNVF